MEVFNLPRALMDGAEVVGDALGVLPVLYHLLWKQLLVADLAVVLSPRNVVGRRMSTVRALALSASASSVSLDCRGMCCAVPAIRSAADEATTCGPGAPGASSGPTATATGTQSQVVVYSFASPYLWGRIRSIDHLVGGVPLAGSG